MVKVSFRARDIIRVRASARARAKVWFVVGV
jgi:hypothetical protein